MTSLPWEPWQGRERRTLADPGTPAWSGFFEQTEEEARMNGAEFCETTLKSDALTQCKRQKPSQRGMRARETRRAAATPRLPGRA